MDKTPFDFDKLFVADELWLSRQPEINSWRSDCVSLVETMNTWIVEHTAAITQLPIHPGDVGHDAYIRRVWACWGHHWFSELEPAETGTADGSTVAARICGRQPLKDRSTEGVNLIREVILVQAALSADERALSELGETFREIVKSETSGKGRDLASDDEWPAALWHRLLTAPNCPGKLDGFTGRGSLRRWLRTTIRNELKDQYRHRARQRHAINELGESTSDEYINDPGDAAQADECRQLFVESCRQMLDSCTDEERATAATVIGHGVKPAVVARKLGVHRASVGRRVDNVISRWKAAFFEDTGNFKPDFRDCGEHLFGADSGHRALGLLSEIFTDNVFSDNDQLASAPDVKDDINSEIKP